MYLGRLFGSLLLFLSIPLLGQIDSQQESHILYLIRSGKIETGLILYQQLQEHSHNFSLLRQIGYLLLSQGAKSRDPESQLITMYGMREAAIEEVTSLYRLAL